MYFHGTREIKIISLEEKKEFNFQVKTSKQKDGQAPLQLNNSTGQEYTSS